MVSRVQRIEWLGDAQLEELIGLRRAIDTMQSSHLPNVDGDDVRREIARLSASIERLTLMVAAPASEAKEESEASITIARQIPILLARIENAWIEQIAHCVLDQTMLILDSLARPAAIYRGETELYRVLTEFVEALTPDDTLFAVCADKSWGTADVENYLLANERAAARGVAITRIFQESTDRRVIEAARRQARQGIRARLLRKKDLEHLTPRQRLPAGIGIAIINAETVIMHFGLGESAYAYRFDCPHLVAVVRSQFEIAERLSEAVASKDTARSSPPIKFSPKR